LERRLIVLLRVEALLVDSDKFGRQIRIQHPRGITNQMKVEIFWIGDSIVSPAARMAHGLGWAGVPCRAVRALPAAGSVHQICAHDNRVMATTACGAWRYICPPYIPLYPRSSRLRAVSRPGGCFVAAAPGLAGCGGGMPRRSHSVFLCTRTSSRPASLRWPW
jgi:hypothetical protein